MELTLLYFDDCPNWREAETRVRQALREVGLPEDALWLRRVETLEDAQRLSFRGSPTVRSTGRIRSPTRRHRSTWRVGSTERPPAWPVSRRWTS